MKRLNRCPACDQELPSGAESEESVDSRAVAEGLVTGSESFHSERSRRGRRAPVAAVIRWCSIAVLLTAVVAVIYQASATGRNERSRGKVDVQVELPTIANEGEVEPRVSEKKFDRAAAIGKSVVILETEDAAGSTTLGTGFVIRVDEPGRAIVVTNYHVLSAATSAYARFRDGNQYPVAGYWAVDREMDLALLALEGAPVDVAQLPLRREGIVTGDQIAAVGHPQRLEFSSYDGEVSRIIETNDLPGSSQVYLRSILRGNRNLVWIQHTARLTEGNSGGPLFDTQGRVIGINTWTNREAGFGYALHAAHLARLLESPLPEVATLATYADRGTIAAELREEMSANKLRRLLDDAKSFGFLPTNADQYRKLQELAVALTYAGRLPAIADNSARKQEREQILAMVDQIAHELRERKWNEIGGTTIINELAGAEVNRRMAGVFAFATVDRVVSSDSGSRGMLMTISGTDLEIFVVLDGLLIDAEPATQCLIVGMNFQGQVVRYGDNPLDLHEVPVIVTSSDGIVMLGRP